MGKVRTKILMIALLLVIGIFMFMLILTKNNNPSTSGSEDTKTTENISIAKSSDTKNSNKKITTIKEFRKQNEEFYTNISMLVYENEKINKPAVDLVTTSDNEYYAEVILISLFYYNKVYDISDKTKVDKVKDEVMTKKAQLDKLAKNEKVIATFN